FLDIFTLSLHDALPICSAASFIIFCQRSNFLVTLFSLSFTTDLCIPTAINWLAPNSVDFCIIHSYLSALIKPLQIVTCCGNSVRSEEHTSELQSCFDLV